MGQYKLVADPHATDPAQVQAWISRFNSLPGAQVFLNIPGKPGGTITITDNSTSPNLASGNQGKIAKLLKEGLHGLNQQVGGTNVEFLNPNSPDGKDPVNVLVHEIGHMKWPGLGNDDSGHAPLFYRLLSDSLTALTLPIDKQLDLNGVDIDDVVSPAGNDPLRYNITPSGKSPPLAAPSSRSSIGPSLRAVPPQGNSPAAAPPSPNIVPPPPRILQSPRNPGQPLGMRPPAQSGMPVPGAGWPTSIGGPNGPTPLVPPGASGAPVAPQTPAPTGSPLNFAPDAPRNVGPFVVSPQLIPGSGLGDASTNAPQLPSSLFPRWPAPSLPMLLQNGDPNVGNRAYLGGGYDTPSERLGHVPGGALDSSSHVSPRRDDWFGSTALFPNGIGAAATGQPAPGAADGQPARYLGGRVVGAPEASAFGAGARAVPFVVDGNPLASAPSASFDDRFGNWDSSPPLAPDQNAPYPQSGSAPQANPELIRVLSSRFPELNPGGVTLGNPPSPGAPDPSLMQNGWPPATQPLPEYPVPPMVYGLPDPTTGSMDDWFDRWIRPLFQQ